jgi:hypothetical protein
MTPCDSEQSPAANIRPPFAKSFPNFVSPPRESLSMTVSVSWTRASVTVGFSVELDASWIDAEVGVGVEVGETRICWVGAVRIWLVVGETAEGKLGRRK